MKDCPVVLVIDDEKSVRKSVREYLEDGDFRVLEAENGKTGMEVFASEMPDLVLIDLRMPQVDGLEVLRNVVERSPETPAIVISGAGDIADVIEALHLGAWDYLRKPIEDLSMLLYAIERALERAGLINENRMHREHLAEEVARRTKDLQRANAELEQTAQALGQKEEKLRTLFETTSDWIWEVDRDGIYTFANPRVKDLLGYDVDEIIGASIFDLVSDKEVERTRAFFREKDARPEPFAGWTNTHFHKNGQEVIMEICAAPLFNKDGRLSGWYGFEKDISGRVRAESALRDSRERYRDLVETLNDWIWEVDATGAYAYLSPKVRETLGYDPEELLGKRFWDIMPVDESCRVSDLFKGLLVEPKPFTSLETTAIHKDGHKLMLDNSGKPFFDSYGEFLGYRGVNRDITERKRAEESLRKSQERLALVMEATNDGIWDWDIINDNLYASPRCNEIFGSKEGPTATNTFNTWSSGIHPDDYDRVKNAFYDHMEKNIPYDVEYRHGREGGGYGWQNSWCKALFDKNGKIYRMVGAIRDITDRKRAEEERAELQRQLQQVQKLEALGTLAGGIAHDFNNLLMGIQGRVSLMLMDTDASFPHSEHMKGIESHVRSAADLTRQLLGFARGGKYEVKPSDLNELIKEQNRMFGRTNKEITIRGRYGKDLWPVEVDQGQIQQVLLNLYVNAAHAMPEGGSLTVQTRNVAIDEGYIKPYKVTAGKYVKVSVTDTGVGMDKATRERIFEPFFTTREMGRGTGLGLATVYGIIKNHGGFINVYSEKDIGSTFNIYLPASEGMVNTEDKPSIELLKGQGTVLLVDDEAMVIDVGSEMIKSIGYRVLTAENGKEAVEVYKKNKNRIDMVILDMVMPDMGGGETYDNLKEIDPDIRVLLSSGYSLNGRAAEILDRGCDGFIQKPFDLKGLSNKIMEVLDKN